MKRASIVIKNVLFSIFVCAFFFGMLEAALRIIKPGFVYRAKAMNLFYRLNYAKPPRQFQAEKYINAILNTKEIPHIKNLSATWSQYREPVNSRGFRGPEFSEDKDDKFRIICLGDSITWDGWYLDAMKEELRARSGMGNVEVLNFGLPGRPSLAGLNLFQNEALPLEPDVVTIEYAINDDYLRQMEIRMKQPQPPRALRWLLKGLEQSDLCVATQVLVNMLRDWIFEPLHPPDCKENSRFSLCAYRDHLEKMAATARSRNIKMVFITSHCPFYNPRLEKYKRVMKAVGAEQGIPVLDVQKVMLASPIAEQQRQLLQAYADRNFIAYFNKIWKYPELQNKIFDPTSIYYMDIAHPNRQGHQLIGKGLAELIAGALKPNQ